MPSLESDVVRKANRRLVLLAGATGYVGGRLIPLLEAKDVALRCLARNPEKLHPHVTAETEVVQGDVLDPASLERAMQGVTAAYYLVHLMKSSADFKRIGKRLRTSSKPLVRLAWGESSTWAGWATMAASSRRIFAVAMRWAVSCGSRASSALSFGRP